MLTRGLTIGGAPVVILQKLDRRLGEARSIEKVDQLPGHSICYRLLHRGGVAGDDFVGDVPGPLTLTGAFIVVGAGLYTFFRERRVLA